MLKYGTVRLRSIYFVGSYYTLRNLHSRTLIKLEGPQLRGVVKGLRVSKGLNAVALYRIVMGTRFGS